LFTVDLATQPNVIADLTSIHQALNRLPSLDLEEIGDAASHSLLEKEKHL
jgi:hypothetical protein